MKVISFKVPARMLDALFYGDYTKLSPKQTKALDTFLDGLDAHHVKYKTPIDSQNLGFCGVNALDDTAGLCYRIDFEIKESV